MRISYELARSIANGLTEKTKKTIENLQAEIDKLVIEEYDKKVPAMIRNAVKYFPEWVERTDSIRVICGQNYAYWVKCKNKVIIKGGDAALRATGTIKKKVLLLKATEEKLRQLRKETTSAIVSLGTSKRVIDQFPEAAIFFKDRQKLRAPLPKTNIIDLKAKLEKQ